MMMLLLLLLLFRVYARACRLIDRSVD